MASARPASNSATTTVGPLLAAGGLGDQVERVEHVLDRVGGVGALGGQHRDAVALELPDDLVVGGVGLDDDQVGVGGEERVEVRLAAPADVVDAVGQRLGGVPGGVALDVGDGDRGRRTA